MEVNCTLSSHYLNSIAVYVIKLAFISFLLLKMFLSASTEDFLCISLNTFLYWDFSSKRWQLRPFFNAAVSRRALGSVTQEAPVGVREDDNGVRDSSLDNRSWTIKMLYDGDCPLCMREVRRLNFFDANCLLSTSMMSICYNQQHLDLQPVILKMG